MKVGDRLWWNNKSFVHEVEITPPPGSGEFILYGMVDIRIIGAQHPRIEVAFTADLYTTETEALKAAKEWAESRLRCLRTHLTQAA